MGEVQANESTLSGLPRARFWDAYDIVQWEGFWFEPSLLKPAMRFRSTFEAKNDDVLLASTMKTGTTWLKALCFCIMQNPSHDHEDVLVKDHPQFHVLTVETEIYITKPHPDLYNSPSPRLFHTHLPYTLLPSSIKDSECKIVYIARNPKDTLVSYWHYFNSFLRSSGEEPFPLEKVVDCYCSGVHQYGPFFDHVLQYWTESRNRSDKILFLKYEDLKRDPREEVKRLAWFLGRPFADEAQVDKVLWRCGLERLMKLEINKSGSSIFHGVPNSSFFRRGVVGDSKNYLTSEMEELVDQTTREKLEGSGLYFETSLKSEELEIRGALKI